MGRSRDVNEEGRSSVFGRANAWLSIQPLAKASRARSSSARTVTIRFYANPNSARCAAETLGPAAPRTPHGPWPPNVADKFPVLASFGSHEGARLRR